MVILLAGLEPYGVDVLTICPGFVDTPMTKSLAGSVPMTTPQKAASEMMDAMLLRTRGTVFVPKQLCVFTGVYSLLPMPFRALAVRLLAKHGGDYLRTPN
jgi:NAD(P)-dependent dehydrogenase (short-subunit alcohol dehydrogenase family)